MKQKITAQQLCLTALAIVINVVGGQVALAFRLPIYLDSIGTILVGVVLGPWFGLVPGLLGGLIMAATGDIYSLYFAPVGMIVGMMSGLVYRKEGMQRGMALGKIYGWQDVARTFGKAALVTIPGTAVSSVICAVLFGGITSSGSTVLVQFLAAKTPLTMTESVFVVQLLTDYADRVVSLFLVMAVLRVMPAVLKRQLVSAD